MADYQVTGNEGNPIDPTVAQQWINRFVATLGPTGIRSELFGVNKLNSLLTLNGTDIKGIRVCYSLDNNNVPKIIIYAVNSQNVSQMAFVLEDGLPCPPYCGKP